MAAKKKTKKQSFKAEAQKRTKAKLGKTSTKVQDYKPISSANAKAVLQPMGGKPGQHWVPGTAGVPAPPVQPFMTSDDMLTKAGQESDWAQQLADMDAQFAQLQADTDYQKTNIDKQRVEGLSDAQDDAAARGLFQSSIKDAELFDIEATSRLRKDFLDTQLNNQFLANQRQQHLINDAKDAFTTALNQRMVENAQNVQADNPWQTAPTEGHWEKNAPGPAGAPPGSPAGVNVLSPSWMKPKSKPLPANQHAGSGNANKAHKAVAKRQVYKPQKSKVQGPYLSGLR